MNNKSINIIDVINQMDNILKDQNVLVACSTGIDSTVLLDLVLKTKNIN